MPVSSEPELTRDQRPVVARAVSQFNQGLYFESHETLEDLWLSLVGPSRDFVQALIQISVGFHHINRSNRVGAVKTFTRALQRLESCPARYLGFDVAAERVRLKDLLRELGAGSFAGLERAPIWSFEP